MVVVDYFAGIDRDDLRLAQVTTILMGNGSEPPHAGWADRAHRYRLDAPAPQACATVRHWHGGPSRWAVVITPQAWIVDVVRLRAVMAWAIGQSGTLAVGAWLDRQDRLERVDLPPDMLAQMPGTVWHGLVR
jgi:hypothetical protein